MTKSDRIFIYRIWDNKNGRWHTSHRGHTVWTHYPHFYKRYPNAADLQVVKFAATRLEDEWDTDAIIITMPNHRNTHEFQRKVWYQDGKISAVLFTGLNGFEIDRQLLEIMEKQNERDAIKEKTV